MNDPCFTYGSFSVIENIQVINFSYSICNLTLIRKEHLFVGYDIENFPLKKVYSRRCGFILGNFPTSTPSSYNIG